MSRPEETLPSEVDVVVLGTGLPESILAAACARAGLSVLHLDRNEYYGGAWASFNLDGILKWTEGCMRISSSPMTASPDLPIPDVQLDDGEQFVALNTPGNSGVHYSNVVVTWHVRSEEPGDTSVLLQCQPAVEVGDQQTKITEPNGDAGNENVVVKDDPGFPVQEADEESRTKAEGESRLKTGDEPQVDSNKQLPAPAQSRADSTRWTKNRILQEWRRFSLDLAPKILMGRGSMVELLSQSGVGRYAEFRSVNRLLTFYDGDLKTMPCSRSEVFQSTEITLIEKRALMKFLMLCLNYNTDQERPKWQDSADTPFEEFLSSSLHQLTPKLLHYVLHGLAMVSPSTPTSEGLKAVYEFLMSTGRYGSSPFLWTLYGSGEMPQSFCRLCAVFGGIYCLRRSVEGIIFDSNGNCTGVVSEGHRVRCRWLIADAEYSPYDGHDEKNIISRAILITDQPLSKTPHGKENVTLLNSYVENLPEPVKILEVGAGGCVCPAGLYVVHITTKGGEHKSAQDDLGPVLKTFFRTDATSEDNTEEDTRPRVLWSLFFNCATTTASSDVASNVIISPPVDGGLTYGNLVEKLKQIFSRLSPDTDFIPAAPNPDEVADAGTPGNDPGINGYTPDV